MIFDNDDVLVDLAELCTEDQISKTDLLKTLGKYNSSFPYRIENIILKTMFTEEVNSCLDKYDLLVVEETYLEEREEGLLFILDVSPIDPDKESCFHQYYNLLTEVKEVIKRYKNIANLSSSFLCNLKTNTL